MNPGSVLHAFTASNGVGAHYRYVLTRDGRILRRRITTPETTYRELRRLPASCRNADWLREFIAAQNMTVTEVTYAGE